MIRNTKPSNCCLGLLLVLLLFLSIIVPAIAEARSPHKRDGDIEGDPGDGVLEPFASAVESSGNTETLLLPSVPLLCGGSDQGLWVPLVIFIGSEPTPVILWMPVHDSAHGLFETTLAGTRIRAGRGW